MQRLGLWFLALAMVGFLSCSDPQGKGSKKKGRDSTPVKDKEENVQPGKTVNVVMKTSMGTIEIELYPDKAPITVKNFLEYVDDKFYDGTLFHRVIADFMIQGGGFDPGLKKKESRKPPIKNEAANGLRNARGTIAMGQIPRDPDSATSEFYINVVDNRFLDPGNPQNPAGYCVFGKVIKGMDVVDKIKDVKTQTIVKKVEIQGKTVQVPMEAVPAEEVVIKSVRRAPDKKER
jgi:cyclophilin family peptidyl-prolyl cis-trans isomerase